MLSLLAPAPVGVEVIEVDGDLLLLVLILGLDVVVFSKAGPPAAVSHSFSLALTPGGSSELEDGGLVLSLLIVLW